MPEDTDFLQARLEHARRRVDDASPYSPDWDAATEAVDDLLQRLDRALSEQTAPRLTRPARHILAQQPVRRLA